MLPRLPGRDVSLVRAPHSARVDRAQQQVLHDLLDGDVGRRAGAYPARYARLHGGELAAALVAAAAATSGVRLWTLNRKHYPLPDVRFYGG